jgi:hypothetical protein
MHAGAPRCSIKSWDQTPSLSLCGQERPPQPYPNAAFGLAFARGLWRPPQHYAQVDCRFLELIAGIALQRLAGALWSSAGFLAPLVTRALGQPRCEVQNATGRPQASARRGDRALIERLRNSVRRSHTFAPDGLNSLGYNGGALVSAGNEGSAAGLPAILAKMRGAVGIAEPIDLGMFLLTCHGNASLRCGERRLRARRNQSALRADGQGSHRGIAPSRR